jgi:hypothetical protein
VEKGGLTSALLAEGITPDDRVGFGDEVRITLHGTLARVIVPPGINIRQICQGQREGLTLALCVDGLFGTLSWEWLVSMDHREILRALVRWNEDGFDAVVWDNASSHREEAVQSWGMPLVQQPAYSPELNPAERVNEEIRRFLKGRTFRTLDEKVRAVENCLRHWKANPAYIQRLCGYYWIQDCFELLKELSEETEDHPMYPEEKLAA